MAFAVADANSDRSRSVGCATSDPYRGREYLDANNHSLVGPRDWEFGNAAQHGDACLESLSEGVGIVSARGSNVSPKVSEIVHNGNARLDCFPIGLFQSIIGVDRAGKIKVFIWGKFGTHVDQVNVGGS